MTYQLFPTTPFTRADADFDVEYRSPRYEQLADGSVIVVSTQIYTDDDTSERVRNLMLYRYESDGAFAGAEVLQENAHGTHAMVDVAALADGGFAVSHGVDGSDVMRLRSYDADGTLRGEHDVTAPPRNFTAGGLDRTVETDTRDGALTGLEDGGIAFTFRGSHAGFLGQYSGAGTNFTQVFDADADPVSAAIGISPWVTSRSFNAHRPDTIRVEESVPLADGGYAVILRAGSNTPGGDEDQDLLVAMRLFNADGTARGEAFSVATPDNHDGRVPDAAVLADGSFVVAWTNGSEGFWRRYDDEGEPMGEAVQVAPGEASFSHSSSFTMVTVNPTEDGGFLIIGRDGDWRLAQRYDAEGEPVGGLDQTFRTSSTDHFSSFSNADAPRVFDMGEEGYLGFFNTRFWNREGDETLSMDPAFSYRMYAPDIFGTPEDDVLEAGEIGTALFGFAGDDTLTGGPGNDFFVPGPGDDVIQGGGGINLARFSGEDDDYEINRGPEETVIVTDQRAGSPDGTNTLSDIDMLQFDGGFRGLETVEVADLALDLTLSGAVTDTASEALEDVSVTFTPAAEGWAEQTETSDADGMFTFTLARGLDGRLDASRDYTPGEADITANDALDTLRMAVGLDPSFGPAQGQNWIAADIDGNGQVDATDALEILRAAVGLESENAPRWVFLDAETDWDSVVEDGVIGYEPGIAVEELSGAVNLAMTGILLGNLDIV